MSEFTAAITPPDGIGKRLWAPIAWIDGRWQAQVLLEAGPDGCWARITAGVPKPADAHALSGPVLPAVINAHSHAFQRGFVGLTERRAQPQDDFWSWREQMYSLALRVTPTQMRAIAALLYAELLEGGYSHICEFHYLHHGPDGQPYGDPLAMSRALADAAVDTGIGLTLLPVLYERAGFRQPVLGERQRRFRTTVREVLAIRDEVRRWRIPNVSAGVAIHSLRAASPESMSELARACHGDAGPISKLRSMIAWPRRESARWRGLPAICRSTTVGIWSTPRMPTPPTSMRLRQLARLSWSARALRPISATAGFSSKRSTPVQCHSQSVPTAMCAETGHTNSGYSSMVSAWRWSGATSQHYPSNVRPLLPKHYSPRWVTAAPLRRDSAAHRGGYVPAHGPTAWCSTPTQAAC